MDGHSSGAAGAAAIIGVVGATRHDAGLGVATYSGVATAVQAFFVEFVSTFIFVFTVFGVIHRKGAAGFRRRQRFGGIRGDHPGRPDDGRVHQPCPHLRPDARRAAGAAPTT